MEAAAGGAWGLLSSELDPTSNPSQGHKFWLAGWGISRGNSQLNSSRSGGAFSIHEEKRRLSNFGLAPTRIRACTSHACLAPAGSRCPQFLRPLGLLFPLHSIHGCGDCLSILEIFVRLSALHSKGYRFIQQLVTPPLKDSQPFYQPSHSQHRPPSRQAANLTEGHHSDVLPCRSLESELPTPACSAATDFAFPPLCC